MFLAEAIMLGFALSADAFLSGFSYGSSRIRIEKKALLVLCLTEGGILGISMGCARIIKPFLADWITVWISFFILLCLGIVKLLDEGMKAFIKKHGGLERELEFSVFSIRFVLGLYADPALADTDASKTLSAREAIGLSVALSLDSIAVGFGAVMGDASLWMVLLCAMVFDYVAVCAGISIGGFLARKKDLSIHWLGGILLILLAVAKII